MKTTLLFIMLFPLIGVLYQVIFGRLAPRRLSESVGCLSILASLLMATVAFYSDGQKIYQFTYFTWFQVAEFTASITVLYDSLAAVMALMVTFVSSLIHLYSVAFMKKEKDYVRYFCYLNLFVFFMLVIVLADNLVFLFLGWEGVGFCSYALIGYWYEDLANATAGRKAFLLTRIGDIGFGVAIAFLFATFSNLSVSGINSQATAMSASAATLVGLLLFWAAIGKSAQLPLLVWLPDAMAGPTPVSALIHAATMVTAGVYLLVRLFPVISLSPGVLTAIAVVGAATAFYAACSALAQRDIKRVLAYSTISQVGYMILAVGAGDIVSSVFHLLTHAFFKSLLFLAAGCVIHALHEEHDIFSMGETVRRHLPAVFLVFLAGGLALGGVPPSAGFFSKGRILLATVQHQEMIYKVLWAVATVTALLTTLYTFRLFFLVFTGKPAVHRKSKIQPVSGIMVWALWPLAILSLCGGFMNIPQLQANGGWLASFLSGVPGATTELAASPNLEWKIENLDSLIAIVGLILAYYLYSPKNILGWRRPEALGKQLHAMLLSGFGLDWLYEMVFVRPYHKIAQALWIQVDETVIDNGLVQTVRAFLLMSAKLRLWASGSLPAYLNMLFVGFAVIIFIVTVLTLSTY